MPNLPISQLPDATLPLSPSDLLPVVQVLTTCQAPLSALAPLGLPGPPGRDGETGSPGPPGMSRTEVVFAQQFVGVNADVGPIPVFTPVRDCLIRMNAMGWPTTPSTPTARQIVLTYTVTDPNGGVNVYSLAGPILRNPGGLQGVFGPFIGCAAAGVAITFQINGPAGWNGGVATLLTSLEVLYPNEGEFMQSTVVYSLSLTGVGADIANQILYSPPSKGVFRLSMYQTVTAISSGASAVNGDLKWTDDHGPQDAGGISSLALNAIGQVNIVYVLEAAAGTTINFQMTGGGTYGAARYSLYLVLEQIA